MVKLKKEDHEVHVSFCCCLCDVEAYEMDGVTRTKDPVDNTKPLYWVNCKFCNDCEKTINICYVREFAPGGMYHECGRAKGIKRMAANEAGEKDDFQDRKRQRIAASSTLDGRLTANAFGKLTTVSQHQTDEVEEGDGAADFWPQSLYDNEPWPEEHKDRHVPGVHKGQKGVWVYEKPLGVVSVRNVRRTGVEKKENKFASVGGAENYSGEGSQAWEESRAMMRSAMKMREEERAKVKNEMTQARAALMRDQQLSQLRRAIASAGGAASSGGSVGHPALPSEDGHEPTVAEGDGDDDDEDEDDDCYTSTAPMKVGDEEARLRLGLPAPKKKNLKRKTPPGPPSRRRRRPCPCTRNGTPNSARTSARCGKACAEGARQRLSSG